MPKFPSIDCVGLVWDSEESLAVCLVYHSPRAQADSLLSLLVALEFQGHKFLMTSTDQIQGYGLDF